VTADNELSADNSLKELTRAINHLTELFRTAADEIKAEPEVDIGKKLDVLIKQNEEIAKALLLIMELNREHLPNISRHVKRSADAVRPKYIPKPHPYTYQSAGYKLPGTGPMPPPPPPPRG
jgi:DUF438 domain-containing protein